MGLESHISYVIKSAGFHYNSDAWVDNSANNTQGAVLVTTDRITRDEILRVLRNSGDFHPIKYGERKILLLSVRNFWK